MAVPKRRFEFSPSVQVFLTNLPTIRKVQKMLDEGTVTADVKRWLKYLAVRLQEEIPGVKTWQSEISNGALFLSPRKSWRVVRDNGISVCISMADCIEPAFYNEDDDPFVGLYVPEWKHLQSFTNRLKAFRIPGFQHISGYDTRVENFPLLSIVHLVPFVNQARLDVNRLEKAMVDRTRKLVAREGRINDLISKVRRRAV
jgi:hypothetical protein